MVGYGFAIALSVSLSAPTLFAQAATSPEGTPPGTPGSPALKEKIPSAPAAAKATVTDPTSEKAGARKNGEPGAKRMDDNDKSGAPTMKGVETHTLDKMQLRKEQQQMEYAKLPPEVRAEPLSDALKQEMQRHSRRVARLDRIKAVALETKDNAVIDRVNKLVERETSRHDRFMASVEAKADTRGESTRNENKAKDDNTQGNKVKDDKVGAK
jgi:hypothetical protein